MTYAAGIEIVVDCKAFGLFTILIGCCAVQWCEGRKITPRHGDCPTAELHSSPRES